MRDRVFITLSIISVLFSVVLLGCSKEVKKPSEESILARQAMEVVSAIKEAYMKEDRDTLLRLSTSEEVFALFSFSAMPEDLEFTFRWVDVYDSKAEVYVSWKAKKGKVSPEKEQKGLCLFVLEGRPFKLKKILRENPFLNN